MHYLDVLFAMVAHISSGELGGVESLEELQQWQVWKSLFYVGHQLLHKRPVQLEMSWKQINY